MSRQIIFSQMLKEIVHKIGIGRLCHNQFEIIIIKKLFRVAAIHIPQLFKNLNP